VSHLYASGVCVWEKRFITWCIMYDCGKPLPPVCFDYSSINVCVSVCVRVCERAENSIRGKKRKVRGAGRKATWMSEGRQKQSK